MKKISVRLSEAQVEKLILLSAESGLNQSEVLREIIENFDVKNFKSVVEIDSKIEKKEMEKIAILKYQNYLISNLANNINQISKVLNSNSDFIKSDTLLEAFRVVEKQQNEIKSEMKKWRF